MESNLPLEEILRYLSWLDYVGEIGNNGICLPRALNIQRFLTLAGQEPTLIIGFNSKEGHAWVEVNGKAILEIDPTSLGYHPTLILSPGSRYLIKAH